MKRKKKSKYSVKTFVFSPIEVGAAASVIAGLSGSGLILVIRLYQLILSGLLGPCCRFHPSCSHYWIEALRQHGLVRGVWLGLKRTGKCHPFHPGGVDVVPVRKQG